MTTVKQPRRRDEHSIERASKVAFFVETILFTLNMVSVCFVYHALRRNKPAEGGGLIKKIVNKRLFAAIVLVSMFGVANIAFGLFSDMEAIYLDDSFGDTVRNHALVSIAEYVPQ